MSTHSRIAIRLKAARERAGLTQEELATKLGLDHRQSLTAIEAGERKMSAEELFQASAVLGRDISYFTDAFRLDGEGRFSFRANPSISGDVLDRFEQQAGRWVATYRELGAQLGSPSAWMGPKLALLERSTYEEAQAAASEVSGRWKLGERPSELLQSAMERELGALVLLVDAPDGISGACSQAAQLNAVFVNRREPAGRRNYNLAHELFHLLTWDAMPPSRRETADVTRGGKNSRVEQLANNFAAALLMPETNVKALWESTSQSADFYGKLNVVASELGVSTQALNWRLLRLGLTSNAEYHALERSRLARNGSRVDVATEVLPFSKPFIDRVAAGIDSGRLSVKKAASLLDLSLSALGGLFIAYGLEPQFEA